MKFFNSTFSSLPSMFTGTGMTKRLTFSLLAMGTFGCLSAVAGTATSSMGVSATVSNNCSITAGALTFGAYDPVVANHSAALNGSATLPVNCTTGATANITLDQGQNAASGSSNATPSRQMSDSNSHVLGYALFQDSAHTTAWGNTSGSGASYTGQGTNTSVTVYGQITAGQNVPSASYSDTVVATVTF